MKRWVKNEEVNERWYYSRIKLFATVLYCRRNIFIHIKKIDNAYDL